jgi:opacity protein-like surface antigen
MASAEWFGDVYAGAAFSREKVTARGAASGVEKSHTSATGGGRVGYYFEKEPWAGLALDFSAFKPQKNVTVVPLSILIMLRAPLLTSQQFPKGRLNPYLGIGPGIFITKADTSVTAGTISDTNVDVGLDVRAGTAWQFTKNLAVFGEYRLTHFQPELDGEAAGVSTKFELRERTHHLLGGISIRF